MNNYETVVISQGEKVLYAVILLILSLICLYIWASEAPLESGSIVPGFVRAEGQNHKVEHLTDGKVKSLNVSNGSFVSIGDILIELDNRESKITLVAMLNKYLSVLATRDTANAMINSEVKPNFSTETIKLAKRLGKIEALNVQVAKFEATRQVRSKNEKLLQSKSQQLETSIHSERIKIVTLEEQYNLFKEKLESYQKLLDQKHVARLHIIDLERELARIEGNIDAGRSLVKEKILMLQEFDIKTAQLVDEEKQRAAAVLVQAEENIPVLQANIKRIEKIINDSIIKARVSGKITDLKISSIGETVKSGEELMKILPVDDALVIEARLNPSDIDNVAEGQKARVRLTAYNYRNTPMLEAVVVKISADRMQDKIGFFYELQLEIRKSELSRYPELKLAAGMTAESIIINDKRTVLEYLLEPIKRGISHSMRES